MTQIPQQYMDLLKLEAHIFDLVVNKLTAKQLDINIIFGIIELYNMDIPHGMGTLANRVRALLSKFTVDDLDYDQVSEYFGNQYGNVRNAAQWLLQKHFPYKLYKYKVYKVDEGVMANIDQIVESFTSH